jgi:hypothetical protein
MNWINKILDTNLNAILATVLIHLILLFVILLIQIVPPQQNKEAIIMMDAKNMDEMEQYFEAQKKVDKLMEEIAAAKNLSLEDIRNLSTNSKPESRQWENEEERLSAEELKQRYEDELRHEMYGDKYDKINEEINSETEIEKIGEYVSDKVEKPKQGNESYYSGPALVNVELDDETRGHIYIDIPVFTCKGSGTIVVYIEINENGEVIKTKLSSVIAEEDQECLTQAAIIAAKSSRFSIKKGVKNLKGKITYQFIEQY